MRESGAEEGEEINVHGCVLFWGDVCSFRHVVKEACITEELVYATACAGSRGQVPRPDCTLGN